jgi:hypothetical protein
VRHQLLAYSYDVNLLGQNINTIKRNIQAPLDVSEEVGLEANTAKTKYTLDLKISLLLNSQVFSQAVRRVNVDLKSTFQRSRPPPSSSSPFIHTETADSPRKF